MKQKIFALFTATAMVSAMMTLPISAQADELDPAKNLFTSDSNTIWKTQENAKETGEASFDAGNVTLTINADDESVNGGAPVQVRPVISQPINLEAGVTYTYSVSYTTDLESYTSSSTQDIVYMQVISRADDSKNDTTSKSVGMRHKTGDTDGMIVTDEITGSITPKEDGHLELQLYLRHAKGSVTFSDLKFNELTVPEDAVAETSGRYFTTLSEAISSATDDSTVTLLKDCDIGGDFIMIEKNLYITSDGEAKTITGSNRDNLLIAKNGKNVTLTNVNVFNNTTDETGLGFSVAAESLNTHLTINGGEIETVSHNNGNNSQITINNAKIDKVITRAGRQPDVSGSDCTLEIKGSTINTLIYNSNIDKYTADQSSTITTVTDSYKPEPAPEQITVKTNYVGSYEGDSDGSTAAAWTATFTSNTGTTTTLDTSNIKWTLDGKALQAGSNDPGSVTVTLDPNAAVVYGIIVNGAYYENPDNAGTLSVAID